MQARRQAFDGPATNRGHESAPEENTGAIEIELALVKGHPDNRGKIFLGTVALDFWLVPLHFKLIYILQ
jgi:hypothetical protein